jgi:hypothetical protein
MRMIAIALNRKVRRSWLRTSWLDTVIATSLTLTALSVERGKIQRHENGEIGVGLHR